MKEQKNTPGPWKVDPAMSTQIAHGYSTVAETALTYGLQTAIANAARIVQAVNAFDDLLEAKEYFETLLDAHYGSSFHHIGDGDGIDKEIADKMRNFIARIRKAEQK